MYLYFEDRFGQFNLINPNSSKETVFEEINKYIMKINPKFHIYYIRSWENSKGTCFDVGSHSEFFYLTNKILEN